MGSTERSLTELLQAAQQLTSKTALTGHVSHPATAAATSTASTASAGIIGDDLPRVDRSLAQLMQVGEVLWPGRAGDTAKLPADHEAQASILLGSRGLDLPHMTQRLTTLGSAVGEAAADKSSAAAAAAAAFDGSQPSTMAAFLRMHRQDSIVAALHTANMQTSKEVSSVYWQQQRCEWEQAKQSLLSAFTHSGNDLLNITLTKQDSVPPPQMVGGSGGPGGSGSSGLGGGLSSEELAFSKVLMDYNKQVLCHGVRPNLAQTMYALAQTLPDQEAAELWRVVVVMAEVSLYVAVPPTTETSRSGRAPPPSRAGAPPPTHARTSPRYMAAVVHQARTFLQEKYSEHMRTLAYNDLARAGLGGVPGLLGLVKGYLGVCLQPQLMGHLEDGAGAGGAPVWPLIYYCLRAGGAKEAACAAPDNNSPAVVEVISALQQSHRSGDDQHSGSGGSGSGSGRVTPEAEKRLRLSYRRSVKTMSDPFKRAVYCVLARCDVHEDHSDIVTTTDDYLWLKLYLVDTSSDGSGAMAAAGASSSSGVTVASKQQDVLTLPQLQMMLYKQYGESHFNAYEQPILYTTVLLLTGQFEAAVEFLRRNDRLLSHAVHAAVALHAARLIATPDAITAPLLSREADEPEWCLRLNLARLLLLYTRRFEATHPHQALHYCFLLRDQKTASGEDVFLNCVSELALNSREFDLILGKLADDGTRTPGIVDTFNVDVREVAAQVARDSERRGLHEDAIRLYDLAKNHEKVICILNKLLGQVVHLSSPAAASVPGGGSSGSDRERVLELACSVGLRYREHGHNASQRSAATMHLLLDLATAFDLYHAHRYQEALEVMRRLQVIALTRAEVEARVAGLEGAASEVKDVLPALLLAAITATHRIYNTASGGGDAAVGDSSTPAVAAAATAHGVKHLQEQARAIVTFAGMIPLRLHADVNARLVQLEALIN